VATKKIGLKEAISIGIGGMVGGGIFAVLGLAVSIAKEAPRLLSYLPGYWPFLPLTVMSNSHWDIRTAAGLSNF